MTKVASSVFDPSSPSTDTIDINFPQHFWEIKQIWYKKEKNITFLDLKFIELEFKMIYSFQCYAIAVQKDRLPRRSHFVPNEWDGNKKLLNYTDIS